MAIDWLDVGFNLVIGLVVVFIAVFWGLKIWNQVKQKKGEEGDEELDDMLKIQKLLKK